MLLGNYFSRPSEDLRIGTTVNVRREGDDSDGNLLEGTGVNYSWQVNNLGTGAWLEVGSGDSYLLSALDAGKKLRLSISYVDAQGYEEKYFRMFIQSKEVIKGWVHLARYLLIVPWQKV